MAQPANDATYTPASQPRNHGEPGAFRPADRWPGLGQVDIPSFPTYAEPEDTANLLAFFEDASARQGVTWDWTKPSVVVVFVDPASGTMGFSPRV